MSNQSDWTTDFIYWVDTNDSFFQRFEHLGILLQSFLIDRVLGEQNTSGEIAQRFRDALANCNNISYDEPGLVEAYTTLHFLDRYHRFQLIFRFLVEQNLLPTTTNRTIQALDIGTGPAPTLYALSDMYDLIKMFGAEKDIEPLKGINFKSDYVERSKNFRSWLHFFTEYINMTSEQYHWDVPYHHGSYDDFKNIQLTRKIYRHNRFTSYLYREFKLSYDLIMLSNFLTTEEQLGNFKDEIYQSVLRLRNRGIFLVVGATGQPYPAIYDQLTNFIEDGRYSNYKFKASCKKVREIDFSYSYDDRFGARIKLLLQAVLGKLQEFGVEDQIPESIRNILHKTLAEEYNKQISWRALVFQKRSFVKLGR